MLQGRDTLETTTQSHNKSLKRLLDYNNKSYTITLCYYHMFRHAY
jgi:hypothetical protein